VPDDSLFFSSDDDRLTVSYREATRLTGLSRSTLWRQRDRLDIRRISARKSVITVRSLRALIETSPRSE
jgi:hypothetical protein